MDNKDTSESLLDMYGTEEKKEEIAPVPIPPEIVTEPPQEEHQETPTNMIENEPPKNNTQPIPEEVLQEIKEKDEKNQGSIEELTKLYIGPNANKIRGGGFSFCTFFFEEYYLFYRKQYSYFIILLFLRLFIIAANAFAWYLAGYAVALIKFIIVVVIAVSFKQNYVAEAEMIVKDIVRKNKTIEEQKEAVQKAGGVDRRWWIILIVITAINAYTSTIKYTNNVSTLYFSDVVIKYPESMDSFLKESERTQANYSIGKYNYQDKVINYRINDNVCKYHLFTTDEYMDTKEEKEEIAKKYFEKKHHYTDKIEEKEVGTNTYYYYSDEKNKEDFYLLISKRTLTEIDITYIQDQNKKCHEITDYILENSIVKK